MPGFRDRDVRTAEGNDERLGASGGIGIIARLKGRPFAEEQSTFLVAVGSHLELYSSLCLESTDLAKEFQEYLLFSDLNAKTNYYLYFKSRVFLSGALY